jgi:hypothetical protein
VRACLLTFDSQNIRQFLYTFAEFRNLAISFAMSVPGCLSAWKNSPSAGQIIVRVDILVFFENLSRKFEVNYNLTRTTDTVHGEQYKFLIISRSVRLRMINVS